MSTTELMNRWLRERYAFDESKIKRDAEGKFAEKAGGTHTVVNIDGVPTIRLDEATVISNLPKPPRWKLTKSAKREIAEVMSEQNIPNAVWAAEWLIDHKRHNMSDFVGEDVYDKHYRKVESAVEKQIEQAEKQLGVSSDTSGIPLIGEQDWEDWHGEYFSLNIDRQIESALNEQLRSMDFTNQTQAERDASVLSKTVQNLTRTAYNPRVSGLAISGDRPWYTPETLQWLHESEPDVDFAKLVANYVGQDYIRQMTPVIQHQLPNHAWATGFDPENDSEEVQDLIADIDFPWTPDDWYTPDGDIDYAKASQQMGEFTAQLWNQIDTAWRNANNETAIAKRLKGMDYDPFVEDDQYSFASQMNRWLRDRYAMPQTDEQSALIADILYHTYGDNAGAMLDQVDRYAAKFDENKHKRDAAGRFAKKNESVAAIHDAIKTALSGGQHSPESVQGLADNLSRLTVRELSDLKKQYGISAAGRSKADLVAKVADRLSRGRRESAEQQPSAPQDARAQLLSGLDSVEDSEIREQFRAATESVLNAMPQVAHDRMTKHLKAVEYHQTRDEVHSAIGAVSKQARDAIAAGREVGGAWKGRSGTLMLDGGTKKKSAAEIYAHEFMHAVDGMYRQELTLDPEWTAAFESEGSVSNYGNTSPQESFAEFGRLMYALNIPTAKLQAKFPKSMAFMQKHGLLPGEDTGPEQPVTDIFEGQPTNDGDTHADHLASTAEEPEPDVYAPESLFSMNQGLVNALASKMGGQHEQDELRQVGRIALWKASQQWKPDSGTKFSTFAYTGIAQAIKNAQRTEGRQKSKAQEFGVDEEGGDQSQQVPGRDAAPDEDMEKQEQLGQLQDAMKQLQSKSPDAAKMVMMKFSGRKLSEIAAEFGITEQGASQAVSRAVKKLQTMMGADKMQRTGDIVRYMDAWIRERYGFDESQPRASDGKWTSGSASWSNNPSADELSSGKQFLATGLGKLKTVESSATIEPPSADWAKKIQRDNPKDSGAITDRLWTKTVDAVFDDLADHELAEWANIELAYDMMPDSVDLVNYDIHTDADEYDENDNLAIDDKRFNRVVAKVLPRMQKAAVKAWKKTARDWMKELQEQAGEMEADKYQMSQHNEQAALIADILAHVYGDEAADILDAPDQYSLPQQMDMWIRERYGRQWDESMVKRDEKGRFATRAGKLAHVATSIQNALQQPKTPQSAKALADELSQLTVKELTDLKKQYQISASGRTKADLVQKLASRLDMGRREEQPKRPEMADPAETLDADFVDDYFNGDMGAAIEAMERNRAEQISTAAKRGVDYDTDEIDADWMAEVAGMADEDEDPEPQPKPAKPPANLLGDDDDEPFVLQQPRKGRKQEKFETAPSGPQKALFDTGKNDLEGQNLLFNTDAGAGEDDPTTMENRMKGKTKQKPPSEMTLAEKLQWQKDNPGKGKVFAKPIPKPKTMVEVSGASFEFVRNNPDGTVKVRNDQGDTFDTELGEEVRMKEGAKRTSEDPIAKYRQPEDRQFEKLLKLKASENKGDGIYYFSEKAMTAQRRKSLMSEKERGRLTGRIEGTKRFEFKPWAEVTGDPAAKGYAILDRTQRLLDREQKADKLQSTFPRDRYSHLSPRGERIERLVAMVAAGFEQFVNMAGASGSGVPLLSQPPTPINPWNAAYADATNQDPDKQLSRYERKSSGWITLNAEDGEGTKVYIGEGGKVTAGPKGMTGKTLSGDKPKKSGSKKRDNSDDADDDPFHAPSRSEAATDSDDDWRFEKHKIPWQARKAVDEVAERWGVDADDMIPLAQEKLQTELANWETREAVKKHARKSLGLNSRVTSDMENSRSKRGEDFANLSGLDEFLTEAQDMYPDFNWGDDPAQSLMDAVHEGAKPKPRLHDKAILDSAARYLFQTGQVAEAVPFSMLKHFPRTRYSHTVAFDNFCDEFLENALKSLIS